MTYPHSTITQDEYDALKVTLAARDAEIEWLQIHLANMIEVVDHLLDTTNADLSALHKIVLIGARGQHRKSASSTPTDAKTP